MRVAYFINQYPAVSHTFIRREIRALEILGQTPIRYALRAASKVVDPEDHLERHRTNYILDAGFVEFSRCSIRTLSTRPLAVCRTVALALKLGWRSERGLFRHLLYLAEAVVLACWCRRDGIQHIHAHFGTNSATIAMFAWQLSGIPYSFTVHGPEEFDKAPLIGLAEKIRRSKFTVAISSYGRSQLYRCVEFEYWKKINVVHCGVEPGVTDVANVSEGCSRRFVCVGRLSRQKGHLLLLEAAYKLASRGQEFDLILAGDGEMRAEIEAQIGRYDLQSKVRILGWIDGIQVQEEIRRARALVLPSFAEGLPVVIMEAMALMRPVISTFVAGIPELVKPGENGWLVPAGDVDALVEAMQACLQTSNEALIQMGKAAQERVLLDHNVNKQAVILANLFQGSVGVPN